MRKSILQALLDTYTKEARVLAMFEGGSAAFGRADELSDLDIQVVVKDEFVAEAVEILDRTVAAISPVDVRYVLPQPAWHGQWQAFYRLKDAGPYLLLDIMICKESAQTYFSEPELHGASVVFFDKTGRVGNEHLDREKQKGLIEKRAQEIRVKSDLFHVFVDKEAKRGRDIDAFVTYQSVVLNPLVETLRMLHCPDRFNYGPKYLQYDLPQDVYREVAGLFAFATKEELLRNKERAYRWLCRNLEQILGAS